MQNTLSPARTRYRERLSPSLWILVSAAMVGPMIALVLVPAGAVIALALGIAAGVLVVAAMSALAPRISVAGTELRAGPARIDARWLGEPRALSGDEARLARGPELSARSWNLIRGGIGGLVVVPLEDPDDPVAMWTISTRTPERLAAAIDAARAEARGHTVAR